MSTGSKSGSRRRGPCHALDQAVSRPRRQGLAAEPPAKGGTLSFEALGGGLTFIGAPLDHDLEIYGSPRGAPAHRIVDGRRRHLPGGPGLHLGPPGADLHGRDRPPYAGRPGLAAGASHRKLDPELSRPWRPCHTHERAEPLTPGETVDLDVEIWPTSIVVPKRYRLALSLRGRDYEWQATTGARLSNFKNGLRGCGPFLHHDPRDRPAARFGGTTMLHIDPAAPSYLLLPVVP